MAIVGASLHACSSFFRSNDQTLSGNAVVYHWENLHMVDGRYLYLENGENIAQTGIDVSEHQGAIDWNLVANDDIDFAFVRLGNRGATSGALRADEHVVDNLDGAASAGIDVGAYFFSQATNESEAVEEAEFALELLAGRRLALPIVYDHESVPGVVGRADGLTDEQLTANARAFCERIEKAGYDTMIYGNFSDLSRYDLSAVETASVWFAEYGVAQPSLSSGFSIWQYSNTGCVEGIDVDVDMNVRFA